MKALFKIIILTIFYAFGTLSYDTVYLCTLNIITFFSDDKINFYGKLWDFLGKPMFGCLLLAIPILGQLGVTHFKIITKSSQFKYWANYFLLITILYFAACYFYFLDLLIRIEDKKIIFDDGKTQLYNVNIYIIASATIILATTFQYLSYRFLKSKRKQ